MNATAELAEEIDKLLRGLRSCDTQATAVQWMTRAHKAMERSLDYIKESPAQSFIFVPECQKLEIVQAIPPVDMKAAIARRRELQEKSHAQTVVYQNVFTHPGLRVAPKPWTRKDTIRLEKAANLSQAPIQRRGR